MLCSAYKKKHAIDLNVFEDNSSNRTIGQLSWTCDLLQSIN